MQNNHLKIEKIQKDNKNKEMALELLNVADSGYLNGSPWTKQQFLETLNTKHTHVYVAYFQQTNEKEKIVGFLIAVDTKIEMDIYMIAIREAYKNQKIGGKLFHELLADARDMGVESIYLEVRQSNGPAIRLYQRIGFIEIGKRKKYYVNPSEDALLMRLDLVELE